MSLHLHKSNRTERLVDALITALQKPLARVFDPEWIVVASPGMERWLSLELAKRLGVWANPQFPFPRKLIDGLLDALAPVDPERALAYHPLGMTFAIARVLQERCADPAFAEVQRYCGDDRNGRRALELARRLAEVFDQYFSYRPDVMLDWSASGGEGFQPALFRALCDRLGPDHLPRRARTALDALERGLVPDAFPERVHLFGISSLPPLYLDLLSALGRSRELHLYVLSPSREYYGDLRPTRGRRAEKRQLRFEDAGFRSEGHALLGSLGRHAREFQELLEERTQYVEARTDLYQAPASTSLLHVVQADLLALRARGSELPREPLAPDDESITIHACHSPMRELEVLHDQLVHWVSERGVQPHEILVLTPDISGYAKVIDAVFSQPREQRPALPFRIADRGVSETQALWLALDALLDVLQSRFGANQVLDLLGFDLIRERFAIAVDQVETLRAWLDESGVRWGIDAAHRASVDQPACDENSWRFGLSRLALGYSTAAAPEQLFAGCAPSAIDSGDGALLGNFLEFCEALFALRARFAEPADAGEWRARFAELLLRMFGERDDDAQVASDRKLLREALRELDEHAARAGFSGRFELQSLRSLLAHKLSARAPAQGFLSGGVTFCQLMPMRSIPFKVLCLIGLHDGVFPASDTPFAFDLMQHDKRRLGDRSRRDDDRQLFLEALLCAREALIITFVGQSQRDGKPLPPSVLVHELIDHAANSCELPEHSQASTPLDRVAAMEQRLLVRHPLTSGSPRYFGADADPRLFSYATAACKAAVASSAPRARELPFARMSPVPLPELRELRLTELERCLMRPSREFCQRRLGLYLGDDVTALAEREPFALNHLERWHIGNQWLEQLAGGLAEHNAYTVERARGRLPLHVAGELLYEDLDRDVAGVRALLTEHTRGEPLPPIELQLDVDGVRLVGVIEDIWPNVHARAQFSRLGSRHELRHFIRHVALRALAERAPELHLPEHSLLVARDGGLLAFRVLGSALSLLRELIELYRSALEQPLPSFAGASRKYVERLLKGEATDQALRTARSAWLGSSQRLEFGSDQDPYVRLLYPDFDAVLNERPGLFEQAALRLYKPLLESRVERQ